MEDKQKMERYRLGIDIGSTTLKMALVDEGEGNLVFDVYERHQAKVLECLHGCLHDVHDRIGESPFSVCFTGSVGMGVAERLEAFLTAASRPSPQEGTEEGGAPSPVASPFFVQEVVAAATYIRRYYPHASTMIDIGGEDAKMVFFNGGKPADLRMNGNCAGGTGAFIDQMAILLNMSPAELGALAGEATRVYPIASRCGVFCKTDIQNLVARNVPRADVAASIFHAVAVQVVTTLAHGHDITAPLLLCGGPLTFIPALRRAFADYLKLPSSAFLLPPKAHLLPAWGAALSGGEACWTVGRLLQALEHPVANALKAEGAAPEPVFGSPDEYEAWQKHLSRHKLEHAELKAGRVEAFIGIDSGSTTTKITVTDGSKRLLFSYYHDNDGDPVGTVEQGLRLLSERCKEHGTTLVVAGSCSTGYGEDLVRAAFHLHGGIVETIAHYLAARHIEPEVSFILDIGGQDMKALFLQQGHIYRMEVNEACSSGCGSFISTFARSLGTEAGEFARLACLAEAPCDLGTRCTVFMNSKVKQVLREGASVADIAAGLAYSVVKNCLYKVLRLKDNTALGTHIVVQGGTMRNDAVVRALEKLTGKEVSRSDCPELMGALGCALYAVEKQGRHAPDREGNAASMRESSVPDREGDVPASRRSVREESSCPPLTLEEMLDGAAYTTAMLSCKGCANHCTVSRYRFKGGGTYYSGNRCEKVFSNQGCHSGHGKNAYERKRELLFHREEELPHPLLTIGIPRCLNQYEEYPFWHTLLQACNIQVRLSSPSDFARHEQCAAKVMSDNICFPAKLVHSHIDDLLQSRVDRIFMPFVVYERQDSRMQNSYNCPVVSGYSQVIRSVQAGSVPIDTPAVTFKDRRALYRQCRDYLVPLGVEPSTVRTALRKALDAQAEYERSVASCNRELLSEARREGRLVVLLAGRPYHADELVQHKVAEMVAAQGACVLTDDIVREQEADLNDAHYLAQWAFPNRILKAAQWVAKEGEEVQFMQLTSFGCGPDAFLADEVQARLAAAGKNATLLKVDDVDNIGSLRLRVRSLVESLRLPACRGGGEACACAAAGLPPSPVYTREQARKKLLLPFFTPFISPLLPSLMKVAGYDAENLPMSDADSCLWGLKYSNNEVCYPATLIVGDIIKAYRNGAYDPRDTCVAMTQTGGQCRASNYLSLIRKALAENGYADTPVVAVTFGSGIRNYQPGFHVDWLKMLPIALAAILYSDSIARLYYATVVREARPGEAARLRDHYLQRACPQVERRRAGQLYALLTEAAEAFRSVCRMEEHPRVGIVGEIFLKFNPFAQKHVVDWLVSRHIEVVYPALADFFLQGFVNAKQQKASHLGNRFLPGRLVDMLYALVQKQLDRVNASCRCFPYFVPFDNIFDKAAHANPFITLDAQFGEGWLIAGEVATLAAQGVSHVLSLQPFGCIANHIVSRGIENRLKRAFPQLNLLSLDFDSSVSEVNITNRLLLFTSNL